ncbi:MAG: ribosomal protein L13e [Candidatus Bathyarchaeota archaeon]|nr:ribosomal protein L13e [Candidatus Bathyarchaeota archaeon]
MHHIKPTIIKQNGKQKPGKGFSLNEIKQAGITKQQAQQMKLPIDPRRKSIHEINIATIKAHAPPAKETLQQKA